MRPAIERETMAEPTDLPKRFGTAPDLAAIEAIAAAAFDTIPEELAQHVQEVIIRVEDFPDAETEEEMELETPFDLLGLYRGRPLGAKSVSDVVTDIDMIFLYRRPLLDFWCDSGEDLEHLVRHVLIHEIGHHFGYSDEDMERLEQEADARAADAQA
jgi:predicted Zn-dependent protease with MMP-like domain